MAYAGVQMFMEKLHQLIHSNDIPMINNPSIVCKRPQFLLLYVELGSMIQTLFIHQDQDLPHFEEVNKLKKKFKAVAEEAEDIVDLFLSTVHFRNNGYLPRSDVFHPSLHLEVVMRSIKSIEMEFMTMSIDNMKMDSSQRSDRDRLQMHSAAGTSHTENPLGSKKVLDEIVVGLDSDVELIRDKLVEDRKQLDVVSIVGMGGIGKTTLANKVFTDPFVVYHFYVCAWVTVSQTYEKRDMLIQILSSMGVKLEIENENEARLCEMVYKNLKSKRYLIVIDDIWNSKAWAKLKLVFPDDYTGSRILLTTRLTKVALQVKSDVFVHQLQCLTEEESWELLCGKVFQGDECPEWLIEPGMRIAKNCHGLPLSVVVMAGVLAKEPRTEDLWVKISCSVHSCIASDEKGCLETIALSYDHLPLHLRDCFLYLGGFPEDSRIFVERLIWLWMAEGFIHEDGCRSLQEIAKGYLMDLVDRNLVIVAERKFNGDVRVCKLHDLVRELCVEKAKEERFCLRLATTEVSLPFDHPLRLCFLYLGLFGKGCQVRVKILIHLWIDAGFVQGDGSQSLKKIAKGYLVDLVDRNLVMVEKVNRKGGYVRRFCQVHDHAWKLIGPKDHDNFRFPTRGPQRDKLIPTYGKGPKRVEVINTCKQHSVFTDHKIFFENSAHPPPPRVFDPFCALTVKQPQFTIWPSFSIPSHFLGC